MFQAFYKETLMILTVYAVDFNHDAFLVGFNGRFKWMQMDNFSPVI